MLLLSVAAILPVSAQQSKKARVDRPLDDFLSYSVDRVTIITTTQGCFHFQEDTVDYVRSGARFEIEKAVVKNRDLLLYNHTFLASQLDSLLQDFNLHYDTAITKAMFSFEPEDYDDIIKDYKEDGWREFAFRNSTSQQVKDLAKTIKKMDDSHFCHIMTTYFMDGCTTRDHFEARIVNGHGDTLLISGEDASCTMGQHPYMLPVQFKVAEYTLPCTHIPILRFLADAMPKNMVTKRNFSEKYVLMRVLGWKN